MILVIDTHSGVPIYRQLMDQITRQILAGQICPGDQLPTVRELAVRLKINPMTTQLALGATANPNNANQPAFADMKGWGRWERVLTKAEKTALMNKEYWPFNTTTSLRDAKAYFKLDEASGATLFTDATGRGNTLSLLTGGVTRVTTGPLGAGDNALNFNGSTWIGTTAPGLDLQYRRITHTVAGWVRLTAFGTVQQGYWCQFTDNFNSGLNVAADFSAANRFVCDFDGGNNAELNTGVIIIDNIFGAPSLNTWYLLIAELDVPNNHASLSINNGSPNMFLNRLQPTRNPGKINYSSTFYLNQVFSFSGQLTGWDYTTNPIAGNSNASMNNTADVSISTSKTIYGWFKLNNISTVQTLAGISDGTNTNTNWLIQFNGANTLSFILGVGATAVSLGATVADNNWHLVVAWYDSVANKSYLCLDNGSVTSSGVIGAAPNASTALFMVGADSSGGVTNKSGNNQLQGSLNAWGFWPGTPLTSDLSDLWNNGKGLTR